MCLQVRNDYMKDLAESIEPDVAIRLGCIEMRYNLILHTNVNLCLNYFKHGILSDKCEDLFLFYNFYTKLLLTKQFPT